MAKVVSFSNQKGGVGKTTSCVNISAQIANKGKRVLLIDMDPQGNATSGLGVPKAKVKKSIYDVLIGRCNIEEAIIKTNFKNLSVIPATIDLAGAELELHDIDENLDFTKISFDSIADNFDYIFIDCPPSLGLLTINALCAADGVIVPMQCEYFALEGLSQLMKTLQIVKKKYNPNLTLDGVVVTMFDGRLNLSLQVLEEIKKHLPGKLFRTPVPRNVRLSEAPSYGMPIKYYDKHSKGAKAYEDISEELIERL